MVFIFDRLITLAHRRYCGSHLPHRDNPRRRRTSTCWEYTWTLIGIIVNIFSSSAEQKFYSIRVRHQHHQDHQEQERGSYRRSPHWNSATPHSTCWPPRIGGRSKEKVPHINQCSSKSRIENKIWPGAVGSGSEAGRKAKEDVGPRRSKNFRPSIVFFLQRTLLIFCDRLQRFLLQELASSAVCSLRFEKLLTQK